MGAGRVVTGTARPLKRLIRWETYLAFLGLKKDCQSGPDQSAVGLGRLAEGCVGDRVLASLLLLSATAVAADCNEIVNLQLLDSFF